MLSYTFGRQFVNNKKMDRERKLGYIKIDIKTAFISTKIQNIKKYL